MTETTPEDLDIQAPLAPFKGGKPAAPRWFEQAVQHEAARSFTEVQGARSMLANWPH